MSCKFNLDVHKQWLANAPNREGIYSNFEYAIQDNPGVTSTTGFKYYDKNSTKKENQSSRNTSF